MLHPTKGRRSLVIFGSDNAADGAIGDMRCLCFEDEAWTIRYLVVESDVPITRLRETDCFDHHSCP
jgi:hypothetical protein